MKCKIMCMSFLVMLLSGCQAAQKAQISLAAGMSTNAVVSQAFFVKSWTLNRALITESRRGWFNEAEKQIAVGDLSSEKVTKILAELNRNIGLDEAITSENFAYLSYLLVAHERANQFLGQADLYLESRKPIWKHLSRHGRTSTTEILEEIEAWSPLIRDIRNVIPKSLLP